MQKCKIKGCGGCIHVKSAALCSRHYNRLRTTGTTDDGPRARLSLSDRFWSKVDRKGADECWPWIGGSWTYGYGSISVGGREGPKTTSNRAAWRLTRGEIPEGMVVRHMCHNRACCNPSHLKLGSRSDNVHDMWSRPPGEAKGNARLTEIDVAEIRASHQPPASLAQKYNVTKGHISAIKQRRCWAKI